MKVAIINGPNLNMIGIREPNVYGNKTYQDLVDYLNNSAKSLNIEIDLFQSNHEGAIIDYLHQCYFNKFDGIIINPGAYTHYSYAILDAIKAINIPTVEVHLSDIYNREDFRKISVISSACIKTISGLGFDGYYQAMKQFQN